MIYWIKLELRCEDCAGDGYVQVDALNVGACSGCDGTGFQTERVTLAEFKDRLEGA